MAGDIFCKIFDNVSKCNCLDEAVLFCAENQTNESYKDLCQNLETCGYCLYTRKEENNNIFATYKKAGEVVNAYFTPCDAKVRMVCEKGVELPPRAEDNIFEAKTTPLIIQVKTGNLMRDCGMSYIIRLSDGRFVLIDSAYDEYEETERILDILQEHNTIFEKPVFAACFFTHAHDDHIGAFTRLIHDYADRVVFGDIIFNWANPERLPKMIDHTEFDECVKGLKGARVIKARSGQRFCYADSVFDILYTCDDLYPKDFRNFNDTSTVMRMELNGRRVIWLGDALSDACDCITARYGSKSLKSEFMQVAHHGYWGGSAELNRLVDPEVLLWPVPNFWYSKAKGWKPNDVFFESATPKKIFVRGRYQTVIDMQKPVPEVAVAPEFAEGDVIYFEDFSKKMRVIDLDWVAVMGGKTGCRKAELKLENRQCIWKSEGKTVLEILSSFELENARSYKLELVGEYLKKTGKFGLIYNNPEPTDWDNELFARIDIPAGKFSLELVLDAGKCSASIILNEKTVYEERYIPAIRRGLYLVLENGEIIIEKITVRKL